MDKSDENLLIPFHFDAEEARVRIPLRIAILFRFVRFVNSFRSSRDGFVFRSGFESKANQISNMFVRSFVHTVLQAISKKCPFESSKQAMQQSRNGTGEEEENRRHGSFRKPSSDGHRCLRLVFQLLNTFFSLSLCVLD